MLTARFFLAAWDYSLRLNRLGIRSQAVWCADLPTHRPTPLLRDIHHPVELPFCVTPSACLMPVWFTGAADSSRRICPRCVLSIAGFGMGASKRVREYQPVIHRLRLSASPYVPTYPGRIRLPQEPLVIRPRGFSPLFRYSCLHSHSSGVHGWITPPLRSPPDAPLPTRAPGPSRRRQSLPGPPWPKP